MADEYYADVDTFAVVLEKLFRDSYEGVHSELPNAVRKSCQTGKRQVRRLAESEFKHGKKHLYPKGWSYRIKKSSNGVTGEIGNKLVPGLPHLLEKGHAKTGGGRVEGREHISIAADKAVEALLKNVGEAVDKGL